LLEGLVVALERLLGAFNLGADGGEPLLEFGPALLGLGGRPGERVADESLVAVDPYELVFSRRRLRIGAKRVRREIGPARRPTQDVGGPERAR
jgi:hypothetical protein